VSAIRDECHKRRQYNGANRVEERKESTNTAETLGLNNKDLFNQPGASD